MNFRIVAITLLATVSLSAQITDYLGPGILTRGDAGIGQRGGSEDINIRPYINISGFYDNGQLLVGTDPNGGILKTGAQYGMQAQFGAYGRHNFRRSVLSLDYSGNYRHYTANRFFNGTNHQLALGYTSQVSRKFVLGLRQTAGIFNQATQFIGTLPNAVNNVVDTTSQLFDNQSIYLQSSMSATYLLSPRTSMTANGSGYLVRRRSAALVGLNGWTAGGSLNHRVSPLTTVGVTYSHQHVDFPQAFGESNINGYSGIISRQLGRTWTFSLQAGVYQVETEGLQQVAADPAIRNLFGNRPIIRSYFRQTTVPNGKLSLSKQFRSATWSVNYGRGVNNGNGVYLTSQTENLGMSYSLQGRRKWTLSFSGGFNRLRSVGQDLARYQQYYGSVHFNYQITPVMSLTGGLTQRKQNIAKGGLNQGGQQVVIGFSFSPAGIPLSLY